MQNIQNNFNNDEIIQNLQEKNYDTIWLKPVDFENIYGITEKLNFNYELIKNKKNMEFPLPYYKFGKSILYKKSEIDEWIENYKIIKKEKRNTK